MNSIEERDNLIQLMQEALKFYADPTNYIGPMGTIAPIYSDDYGSQARFALEKVKQLNEQNQKIQDDYDKLILEAEELESTGETSPLDLINIFIQTRDDKNV
jgi:hypothetical protein